MVKKIILYGASNSGDEFVQLFRDITKDSASPDEWEIIGLLDDNDGLRGTVRNGINVLGNRNWLKANHRPDYYYACCIGKPSIKKEIIGVLDGFGVKYATAVHPSVIISDSAQIGEGTLVTAGNIITTNVKIGNHVIINLMCNISHNTVVGDYSTINPGAKISGDIIIGQSVYIGTNAAVLDKLTIGDGAIVGGGALVNKHVPANVTVAGVPARLLKKHG